MGELDQFIRDEVNNLPPLPDSVLQIQRICGDPDSALKDLAVVVESDPLLTANLLRQANSPYYGYAGRINTVAQAVSLFGMTTVLGFALSAAVRNSFKIDLTPYGLTPNDFAEASKLRSSLMFNWFARNDRELAETLVPAAFIDGVGKVVIATVALRTQQAEAFRELLQSGSDTAEVERRFANTTAQQVTAYMLEQWGLDPLLSEAIRASDDPIHCEERLRRYAVPLAAARLSVVDGAGLEEEGVAKAMELVADRGLEEAHFVNAVARLRDVGAEEE